MSSPEIKFRLFETLRSKFTDNPPKIAVTSTGSLHVNAVKLLNSPGAINQIDALRGLASESSTAVTGKK
jgi:hypothetical protein